MKISFTDSFERKRKPLTIVEFGERNNLELRIGTTVQGGYYVSFDYTHVKEGCILSGATGFGSTIQLALDNYCRNISDKILAVDQPPTYTRREIQTPLITSVPISELGLEELD